ncbi:MAG: crotonobetainyl-CoA:carnitine CoA-transferase CaiB-like acyl-CoA transferase [Alteromonadaceae bacterium]|jgi:crotonobetainyl-CoA:carnitine CoA-transferase CaiB-like acyl-CoA transferase
MTALKGIKVIDLSRILAGPWASQMLADFGAEVIKVEKPISGDDTRYWGPPFIKEATNEQPPQASYFHSANRNKQAIAVDISRSEGQQLIRDLVLQADVFIENYKVGGLKKYGLDYDSLKIINPRLVYCSITGFGQNGPSAHRAGYDAMIQAEGGLMSLTGQPDGAPMKVGVAVVDIMTGLYSCNAILAALMARTHTQAGQYIDIALLDVQVATLANQGLNYLTTKILPNRLGNEHPNIVPYQVFATQDGSLLLAIGNDAQFEKFCLLIKRDDLFADQRFSRNEQRVIHRKQLIPILAVELASRNTLWWLTQLEQASIPCGGVNTLAQVFEHPQIKHRKMVKQLANKHGELVNSIANPINLSVTPIQYRSASPELGEHTIAILTEQLNYTEEKINELLSKGIIQ